MPRTKWSEIRDELYRDPERRRRIEAGTRELLGEITLGKLRRARGLTQEQLADAMGTPQTAVSRLERQTDLYVSTLRRYVEAMGGQLEIRAVFDDQVLPIDRFGNLDERRPDRASRDLEPMAEEVGPVRIGG